MNGKFKPVFGVPDPLPPLVNLPPGVKRAKARFRLTEYATVALRYSDGSFDRRYLSWGADGSSVEPAHPLGANMHKESK